MAAQAPYCGGRPFGYLQRGQVEMVGGPGGVNYKVSRDYQGQLRLATCVGGTSWVCVTPTPALLARVWGYACSPSAGPEAMSPAPAETSYDDMFDDPAMRASQSLTRAQGHPQMYLGATALRGTSHSHPYEQGIWRGSDPDRGFITHLHPVKEVSHRKDWPHRMWNDMGLGAD